MSYVIYWRGKNGLWYFASQTLTHETAEDLALHTFRGFGCGRIVVVQHAKTGQTTSPVAELPGETVFKLDTGTEE